jgi:hypothetical protein
LVPTVLYQNACIITIFCTFLPCRIDEIGTRDEWMVAGIVDGLFVFCIFLFPYECCKQKNGPWIFQMVLIVMQQLLNIWLRVLFISHV